MPAVRGGTAPVQQLPIHRPLLTISEAAEYSGLTKRFVRRIVEERRIRFYKPGRIILLDPGDLDEYLESSAVTPSPHNRGKFGRR